MTTDRHSEAAFETVIETHLLALESSDEARLQVVAELVEVLSPAP